MREPLDGQALIRGRLMSFTEEFAAHLGQFRTAPFLFVGSGLSRRYLGLDTWEGLLRRFAPAAGQPYEYFRASGEGDFPAIASAIAERFHEQWWTSEEYADSRVASAAHATGRSSALKIEVARYVCGVRVPEVQDEALEEELSILRRAVVDGVITTNYDMLLEEVFPDFRVFVGQDQLLFSSPQGVGEIYKIHGSCDIPNSLVLTKEDYAVFDERNPYLAAKLLTVFVEHPVVFLGYSLTDRNVTSILRSIGSCLTTANIDQLRNRLIFVQWDPEHEEPVLRGANIVAGGFNIPVLSVVTSSFLPIFQTLQGLSRRFPARILRQLKEHVYQLVRDNDPQGRLYVLDIDDEMDFSEVDVVIGVGAIHRVGELGYTGLTRRNLIADVLADDGNLDAGRVVNETLPELLRHNRFVPVFKYLRESGALSETGEVADGLDARLVVAAHNDLSSFAPPAYYRRRFDRGPACQNLAEIKANYRLEEILYYAPLLQPENIDLDQLQEYLVSHQHLLTAGNSLEVTQFIKLVCVYDWLKYGWRH